MGFTSNADGLKKGKKRKVDDGVDDGIGPPNKKARPAPKITKGRFKGRCEADIWNPFTYTIV